MHSEFTSERPLSILLSQDAQASCGERIHQILGGIPHRLVHLDAPPDERGSHGVDVAFLTREVTGNSGKVTLSPGLVRFYEIMRASPALRWMQTHAAGTDRPIYAELRQRSVIVTTASGANSAPVAQMAFSGLLILARKFLILMEAQRRRAWEPLLAERSPRDLREQTAVIVGMGRVGQELARLLKALPMTVIGIDVDDAPRPNADEVLAFDGLSLALPRADWVILCCPLTPQTRGLFDATSLGKLPLGAHLINVSRGEVVVEGDLIAALKAGRLAGAYLDVFPDEPLGQSSELWNLPNVIVTPHTAGHTTGIHAAAADIFLDNLARWRDGEPMRNVMP